MIACEVTIRGLPRPQGSMKLFRAPSGHEVAKYGDVLYEWRRTVTAAVVAAMEGREPIEGPLLLGVIFHLPRPKGHYGTGRNADKLKPNAPLYPTGTPDLDKLVRAIGDALTDAGAVWRDDAQVVELWARKRYAYEGRNVGCTIQVQTVERRP